MALYDDDGPIFFLQYLTLTVSWATVYMRYSHITCLCPCKKSVCAAFVYDTMRKSRLFEIWSNVCSSVPFRKLGKYIECMFSLLAMQKYLRITLGITVRHLSLLILVLSAFSVFAPSIKAVKIHLCSLASSLFLNYVALALTAF